MKKPPHVGKSVSHAAFVRLLGGYEKSRSYTKVFVAIDAGISDEGVELHRPMKMPTQSVIVNAHINKMARIADRYVEGGRESFSEPRREYRGVEEANGNFIFATLAMQEVSHCDPNLESRPCVHNLLRSGCGITQPCMDKACH